MTESHFFTIYDTVESCLFWCSDESAYITSDPLQLPLDVAGLRLLPLRRTPEQHLRQEDGSKPESGKQG